VGDERKRGRVSGAAVAQGLYRPGPLRVPYWDRCDDVDLTSAADEVAVDGLHPDGSGETPADPSADPSAA